MSISFTSSLSRYGGDVAVGAMTIITSVNQLITMPLQGICQGGQPIISYNFGAGNKDRVKKAFFTQFCVCATFTIAGWLVMMIAPQLFAGLFTSDTNLADYTSWALRIYMAGMVLNGFPSGMSAKLYGAWTGKGQSAFSLFKKNYSADSADLYFATFSVRQGICCLFGRANQRYFGSNCNDNYIFYAF